MLPPPPDYDYGENSEGRHYIASLGLQIESTVAIPLTLLPNLQSTEMRSYTLSTEALIIDSILITMRSKQ